MTTKVLSLEAHVILAVVVPDPAVRRSARAPLLFAEVVRERCRSGRRVCVDVRVGVCSCLRTRCRCGSRYEFAFRFLLSVPRLARAISMTTRPTPMTTTAASPPRIHQIAFDFFCGGAAAGVGVHCGGGAGRVAEAVSVWSASDATTAGSGR